VSSLSEREHEELVRLAGELDTVERPLRADRLPPEPRMREELDAMLVRRGRVLVHIDRGEAIGWVTTGVADDVADRLAAEGIGILPPDQRAVLAAVLLHCVVLPSARGEPPVQWSEAPRVTHAALKANRGALPDRLITEAISELHEAGIVEAGRASGVRPGPAFDRLTPRARSRIERDLLAIVAGDDPIIGRVLQRLEADDVRPSTTSKATT
jgi:hypothetical protein